MTEAPLTLRMLWALRDDRSLAKAPRNILQELLGFTNADGTCFPSVRTIAKAARTSPGAVRRYLKQLELDAGPLVLRVERGRASNHGDADTNVYSLSLRSEATHGGWDHASPTRDQPSPTVGSPLPQGWDHPDRTGGITGAPEEDKIRRQGEGDREERELGSRRPPPDFVSNEEDRKVEAEALASGVDIERSRRRWLDHEYPREYTDWHARWRSWLREDLEKHRARGGAVKIERATERPRSIRRVIDRPFTDDDKAAVPTKPLAELIGAARVANGA
ncbi:MAG TPA: helix-turn-helix domain-containing protein [Polyangiaceae bacterium]|nr:helix-turn-helix domain-containing protein [Polyangiaceae bacterium]